MYLFFKFSFEVKLISFNIIYIIFKIKSFRLVNRNEIKYELIKNKFGVFC